MRRPKSYSRDGSLSPDWWDNLQDSQVTPPSADVIFRSRLHGMSKVLCTQPQTAVRLRKPNRHRPSEEEPAPIMKPIPSTEHYGVWVEIWISRMRRCGVLTHTIPNAHREVVEDG